MSTTERIDAAELVTAYTATRRATEQLCTPLATEDYVIQATPDVSPTKWHIAHVTWFFETFLLKPNLPGYESIDPQYAHLFNSYYNAVGPQYDRPSRGLLSRPTVADVYAYRKHVDRGMLEMLEHADDRQIAALGPAVTLGINHEQQHQELLLTDIKYNLSINPLRPAYHDRELPRGTAPPLRWLDYDGGTTEVGHDGGGFTFDNESPRHEALLRPYRLESRPVTCGEYLAFIENGGYPRADLWLSQGWGTVQEQGWEAPLYWVRTDGDWWVFTLSGMQRVDEQADDEAQALAEAMQDAADELDGGDTQSQADQTSEQDQRQTEQRSDERSSEQSNTEQRQGEQRLDESQQQAATEERRNREQREVPRNIPDGDQQQREAQEQLAPQPDGQPKGSEEMPRSLQQMLRRLAEAGREAEKGKADSERLREAARKLADTMSEQEKQRLAQRWMRYFGSKRDLGSKPGLDRGQRAQTEPPEEPAFTKTETVDIGGDEEARNIIARWLGDEAIEGDPQRTTQGGEVIRRAQWAAEQAVDQSAVPRRYHEVIRRYFGQLDKTVDKAATSNKSAPPNPTAKPTAKPDGS